MKKATQQDSKGQEILEVCSGCSKQDNKVDGIRKPRIYRGRDKMKMKVFVIAVILLFVYLILNFLFFEDVWFCSNTTCSFPSSRYRLWSGEEYRDQCEYFNLCNLTLVIVKDGENSPWGTTLDSNIFGE
jgi:hypothetical protein